MRSRARGRDAAVLIAFAVASCGMLLWGSPMIVFADSAPVWESPAGLVPGDPDTSIQMHSERVSIHIVERGVDAFALVDADFTMLNPGDVATLKVGFPNWTHMVLADLNGYEQTPYSPAIFSPQALSEFHARSGDREYQASVQQLKVSPADNFGSDWYVWDMDFPARSTTTLRVSYEQKLSWDSPEPPPVIQPTYVLRTGALWSGPIGEVVIEMAADSGGVFLGGPEAFTQVTDGVTRTLPEAGAFLGVAAAAERSDQRAVWRFSEVEPVADIGTTYIFRETWTSLLDGEREVSAGTADGLTYERISGDALKLLGRWGPYGVPVAVLARFPPERVREWAKQAVALRPASAVAWDHLGDIEYWLGLPPRKYHGWLECFPSQAAEAYRKAAEFGSQSAAEKLADLQMLQEDRGANGEEAAPPCASS